MFLPIFKAVLESLFLYHLLDQPIFFHLLYSATSSSFQGGFRLQEQEKVCMCYIWQVG
jgi:hypothetical protein